MAEEKQKLEEVPEEERELELEEIDDPAVLRRELEEAKAKAKEYLDQWKRAAADFANYKRRNEQERGEVVKFANAVLITRILPILDDFERAFQVVPDGLRGLTWIDGIALIERKLQAILEQEGLTAIKAEGEQFDPRVHEALIQEESAEHEEGQIIAELQKGYKLHDRVLRPALVKVAKAPEAKARAAGEGRQNAKED